jgi:hypothetical protein
MLTTITLQPEYASRSTVLKIVWAMVPNRFSGDLHEHHKTSEAGCGCHSVAKPSKKRDVQIWLP